MKRSSICLTCLFYLSFAVVSFAQTETGYIDPEGSPNRETVTRVTNSWTGNIGTAWSTDGNWSLGHDPTLSEDVSIPITMSGRYPIVTETYSCNTVDIEIGTSLEIGNGTLNVTGGLVSQGQLRLTNELAELHVEDLTFNSGATLYIPYDYAEIHVSDDVYFETGSNINPEKGNFYFTGSSPSITTNAYASIYNLISNSPNMRHQAGGSTLTIKGNLTVSASNYFAFNTVATDFIYGSVSVGTGGTLECNVNATIYISGAVTVAPSGLLQFNNGNLFLTGNSSNITTQSGSYFNDLVIAKNSGSSVTMLSNIDVNGYLCINSGASLVPGSYDLNLGGDWYNYAGNNGFLAYSASSSAVIFDGDGNQYVYASENFDQIQLNKVSGFLIIDTAADVWCYAYSRASASSGGLIVYGNFDVYSLWDNSIEGSIYVSGTLTMQQITPQLSVNITGYVHVDGGTFNIYGGTDPCYFSNPGSLNMNGGILAFHDVGISVQEGFSSTISGGILRTSGDLMVNTADFDPAGGTIELFGNTNSTISCVYGATLHHLQVNKDTSVRVDTASDLDINGSLEVASGIMRVYWYTLKVAGNLTEAPTAYLQAPEGTLWLDGTIDQAVNATTEFETLVVDNSATLVYFNDAVFTCDLYDWQNGSLYFINSTFTANDLADATISDGIESHENSVVNLHQDTSQNLYLYGSIHISTEAAINIYGCSTSPQFYGSLTMNGGTLDVKNQGIYFGNTFNEFVSGGIIRVSGSFSVNTSNPFDLSGSLLEMYGTGAVLNMETGSMLGNLLINCATSFVLAVSDLKLTGFLNVQTGSLTADHQLRVGQDIDVYGDLTVNQALSLDWGDLTIHSGGTILLIGSESDRVQVYSAYPALSWYGFTVQSGAYIIAQYADFYNMDVNGINIETGALVNTNHSFHHCTFSIGEAGGTLLKINNNQDLTLFDVTFPENTWSGAYNVSKTNNEGSLHFVLYMGSFGGQTYEQDPNGRINWSQMQVPVAENLAITFLGYLSGMALVRLDWDYPIAEATYNVYHSMQGPEGPFTLLTNVGTRFLEIQIPTTSVRRLYQVRAVLQP